MHNLLFDKRIEWNIQQSQQNKIKIMSCSLVFVSFIKFFYSRNHKYILINCFTETLK